MLIKTKTLIVSLLVISALSFVAACATYEGGSSGVSSIQSINNLPAYQPDPTPEAELGSLVRLNQNGTFACSGVVISSKYVLTAAHCLVDGKNKMLDSIQVESLPGRMGAVIINAKVAGVNLRSDFGLIVGDFSLFKQEHILFSSKRPLALQNLESTFTCGFPYGDEPVCYPVQLGGMYNFQVIGSGLLYPGMSGGPVIHMSSGLVIGVNSAVSGNAIFVVPLVGLFSSFGIRVL